MKPTGKRRIDRPVPQLNQLDQAITDRPRHHRCYLRRCRHRQRPLPPPTPSDYIRDPDRRFAADTVAAIGLCAKRLPKVASTCLEGLLSLSRQGK
ncbi:hypothetical protein U1Q18_029099 [Sarracenia purpurea var. burkii]